MVIQQRGHGPGIGCHSHRWYVEGTPAVSPSGPAPDARRGGVLRSGLAGGADGAHP